ncbi:MAG: response regulator [Sulfurimonas sp.]
MLKKNTVKSTGEVVEDEYDEAETPVQEESPAKDPDEPQEVIQEEPEVQEPETKKPQEPAEPQEPPKPAKAEPSGLKKREVPIHGKIVKEDFQEFAGTRLLLAEDNMINQKVILGLLADSGIEVVVANDGQEALEILEEDSDFIAVLMDAHMPRVDGFEATRRIRQNSDYDHIVIVALSGDTAADDIRKMTEAGMSEHLEKPLKMDALYDVLYAYTSDASQENQEDAVDTIDVVSTRELDGEKGLEICGGDDNFYHEILNEFLQTYSNSDEQLISMLENDELAKADKLLLDIVGVSANIGAVKLNNIATHIKDSLSDHDEKSYLTLVQQYQHHLKILLEDIKAYQTI